MSGRWRFSAILVAATVVVGLVVVFAALALTQLVDPDRPVRDLALRDARAAAELDDAQVWRDSSPCFRRRISEAEFVRLHDAPLQRRAPADTSYSVVSVRTDGRYQRVEVRVEAPAYGVLEYEIDIRRYSGSWVVVDRGTPGHHIADDCVTGGAS